jgi:hypothetical protein
VSIAVRWYCFACQQVKRLLMQFKTLLGELHWYKFNPSTAHHD